MPRLTISIARPGPALLSSHTTVIRRAPAWILEAPPASMSRKVVRLTKRKIKGRPEEELRDQSAKCECAYRSLIRAISQLRQPSLQNLLVRRFHGGEPNSHPRRSRIRHLPQRHERSPAMGDSHPYSCSASKGNACFDKTAERAQIPRARDELPLRVEIHHLDPRDKGVTHSAMLFGLHNRLLTLNYEPLSLLRGPRWPGCVFSLHGTDTCRLSQSPSLLAALDGIHHVGCSLSLRLDSHPHALTSRVQQSFLSCKALG